MTARVTRRDVARAAGVSLTTVTHALNPPPGARVSPKTRERVRRVAQTMGYRPSFVGRALRKGRTYTVGLLQPSHEAIFSHFYQQMILGLVQAMEPDEYNPLVLFCDGEARYLKVIDQGRVDGMIVLQSTLDTAHIDRVAATGIPTVVMNKGIDVAGRPNLGCAHSDHARLMHEVVDEFAACGCRSILEINDYRQCDANRQMFEAFVEATEARLAEGVSGSTLIPGRPDFGQQIRNALAAGQRWDGVFVDGVSLAETFLREADAADYRAARDYCLITSDTTDGEATTQRREASAYTHQPRAVGRAAWEGLQSLIQGREASQRLLVPYRRYAMEAPHSQSKAGSEGAGS